MGFLCPHAPYVCMCVSVFVCLHPSVYLHACMYVCIGVFAVPSHMCLFVHMCLCVCKHNCVSVSLDRRLSSHCRTRRLPRPLAFAPPPASLRLASSHACRAMRPWVWV